MYKFLIFVLLFLSLVIISCGDNQNPLNPKGLSDPDSNVVVIDAPNSIVVDSGSVLLEYVTVYDTVTITDTTADPDSTKIVSIDTTYEDSVAGTFSISWNSVPGAEVYYIFVSDTVTKELLYYVADTISYTVTNLAPNRIYSVSIKSLAFDTTYDTTVIENIQTIDTTIKISHESQKSDSKIVPLRFPESPTSLNSTILGGTLRLSWSANMVDVGVEGYKVYLFNESGDIVDTTTKNSNTLSAFFSVELDRVYKASVITKTSIGYGLMDSIYNYDPSIISDSYLKLPYIYISTYTVPTSTTSSMVGVPGGGFVMGNIWPDTSNNDSLTIGSPAHEVEVSSFLMGKYEVTNSEYAEFLNSIIDSINIVKDTVVFLGNTDTSYGYTFLLKGEKLLENSNYLAPDSATGKILISDSTKLNCAVTGVYYRGAAHYCNYLTRIDLGSDSQNVYSESLVIDTSKTGYRLPTEAEFEYIQSSAFLGTKSKFPWGDNNDISLYVSGVTTAASVLSGKSYYGFYNIIGNALELCCDATDKNITDFSTFYQMYSDSGMVKNPIYIAPGENRVLRGGGFSSEKGEFTSNYRVVNYSNNKSHGFRVARWVK
jgi:formylglycine-generating enzyme required for sulfatase activity